MRRIHASAEITAGTLIFAAGVVAGGRRAPVGAQGYVAWTAAVVASSERSISGSATEGRVTELEWQLFCATK